MARIHVLDDRTANQIAAGEVVERPASVVKELVENSLDAGATRIVVEVEGGGRDLIRITDDGSGMSPEDARLSLERHATSKIRSVEDLHTIASMGFRGEALPSIASVSRFELITRERAELSGYRIYVEGGKRVQEGEHGCPPGTRISVRDLFYNTPARLKYLKTSATEMSQIGDILTRLALANAAVSIRFHSGQTQVFATPGTGRLMETVTALLGREMARELLPVEYQDGAARIWGFVGRPGAARAGRNHQYFFVNRRAIRTIQVRYALEEAYAHLLPNGRYPVCVLFLEVPPEEVDVNVHPTKAEVRFQREREVRAAVYKAARETLGAHLLIPGSTVSPDGEVLVPDRAGEKAAAASRWASPAKTNQRTGEEVVQYTLPVGGLAAIIDQRARSDAARLGAETGPAAGAEAGEAGEPVGPGGPDAGAAAAWQGTGALSMQELMRSLRPLGQVHQSYIICDGPEGCYVIDQHAAHERIFFERLLAAAEARVTPVQPLLFPITLDLTPAQMALWQENGTIVRESGFEAEPFGGRTLLISGVPSGLEEAHVARLVSDFLDRLAEDRLPPNAGVLDRRRRVLAAMAACKAAIKAKDALQPEDIAELLADLATCHSPHTCPHGRPTVICVAIGELEKRFKR